MSGPNAVAAQGMLREYLELHGKLAEHREELKRHTEAAKQCEDRMLTIRPLIEGTVEPVCGSATKPTIRTYTDGRYQTISVFWDGRGGRIAITGNVSGATDGGAKNG
jgi:hypothetical protein